MTKPEFGTALSNEEFHESVQEAFYSSTEYTEAFQRFFEKNYDSLVDEYWPRDSE
jgi:hypothetical protein